MLEYPVPARFRPAESAIPTTIIRLITGRPRFRSICGSICEGPVEPVHSLPFRTISCRLLYHTSQFRSICERFRRTGPFLTVRTIPFRPLSPPDPIDTGERYIRYPTYSPLRLIPVSPARSSGMIAPCPIVRRRNSDTLVMRWVARWRNAAMSHRIPLSRRHGQPHPAQYVRHGWCDSVCDPASFSS